MLLSSFLLFVEFLKRTKGGPQHPIALDSLFPYRAADAGQKGLKQAAVRQGECYQSFSMLKEKKEQEKEGEWRREAGWGERAWAELEEFPPPGCWREVFWTSAQTHAESKKQDKFWKNEWRERRGQEDRGESGLRGAMAATGTKEVCGGRLQQQQQRACVVLCVCVCVCEFFFFLCLLDVSNIHFF